MISITTEDKFNILELSITLFNYKLIDSTVKINDQ
jgi:hypothetical protein